MFETIKIDRQMYNINIKKKTHNINKIFKGKPSQLPVIGRP